ncbi:hypothetical protein D3C72_1590450 [compost metagenome]
MERHGDAAHHAVQVGAEAEFERSGFQDAATCDPIHQSAMPRSSGHSVHLALCPANRHATKVLRSVAEADDDAGGGGASNSSERRSEPQQAFADQQWGGVLR